YFFFSSRRRHTRWPRDWSSDVCSSDLDRLEQILQILAKYNIVFVIDDSGSMEIEENGSTRWDQALEALQIIVPMASKYDDDGVRSEERRVGKECRSKWTMERLMMNETR